MPAEDHALLHYFLQDDLYLLNEDKPTYALLKHINVPVETAKPAFNYLGGNKSRFLILVNYADDEHMAGAHLTALQNTLGRKDMAADDVAIVNMSHYPTALLQELEDFFAPQKILILGENTVVKDLDPAMLNVIESKNEYMLLFSYNFAEMMADRDKAKAFWEQMKNFDDTAVSFCHKQPP